MMMIIFSVGPQGRNCYDSKYSLLNFKRALKLSVEFRKEHTFKLAVTSKFGAEIKRKRSLRDLLTNLSVIFMLIISKLCFSCKRATWACSDLR